MCASSSVFGRLCLPAVLGDGGRDAVEVAVEVTCPLLPPSLPPSLPPPARADGGHEEGEVPQHRHGRATGASRGRAEVTLRRRRGSARSPADASMPIRPHTHTAPPTHAHVPATGAVEPTCGAWFVGSVLSLRPLPPSVRWSRHPAAGAADGAADRAGHGQTAQETGARDVVCPAASPPSLPSLPSLLPCLPALAPDRVRTWTLHPSPRQHTNPAAQPPRASPLPIGGR